MASTSSRNVNIWIYSALCWFFDFCIGLFYRNVSVRGVENIPKTGPVIFAVNHYNGLIDPLFVYSQVRYNRIVRSVAKEDLFRLPLLGFFLRMLGTIPVVRPQDTGGDKEEQRKLANQSAINAMAKVLVDGDCLAIFPEGTSHNNSDILTLKTGFARAALTALETSENIPNVTIIPVGLNYDEKNRFRSDVFVQFGEPINVNRVTLANYKNDGEHTLHSLADELKKSIQEITVTAKESETIVVAHIARSLVRKRTAPLTQEEYILITQKFIDLFENVAEAKPVFENLKLLNSHLRLLNLKYSELSLKYSFIKKILFLIFSLPFTLPGSLYHGPLGLLSSFTGKKLAAGYIDQEAHYKVMTIILLLPIYYVVTIFLLTVTFSFTTALVIAALLAISGILAVNVQPVAVSIHLFKGFAKLLFVNREELLKMQKQIRHDLAPLVKKHMQPLISLNVFDDELINSH